MNKIYYLPKFQNPAGPLPTTFVPDVSKMSSAEQFEFRQKSPLYQFMQAITSEEGKKNRQYSGNWYYAPTKNNPNPHWIFRQSNEPLQPMESTIVEYLPGIGDVVEAKQIIQDFSQDEILNGLSNIGAFLFPGNITKFWRT